MSALSPVELPGSSLPYHRTVRCCHYVRELVRRSILLSAAYIVCFPVVALVMGGRALSPEEERLLLTFRIVIFVLVIPQLLLLGRIVWGTRHGRGILFANKATKEWRAQWRAISEASAAIQRKCRHQRRLYTLPNNRTRRFDREDGGEYTHPEDILRDIPDELRFVTYGQVINQPVRILDVGDAVQAVAAMRLMGAVIAGRLLGREIPFVVMKSERNGILWLRFLTVVDAESIHRAYVWMTVGLQVSGTTVTGFVETVRTYYFGRGECEGGYWYRGDEARAKGWLEAAGEVVGLLTPVSLVAAPYLLKTAFFELIRRQFSGRFYLYYPPDAGDTVDLLLMAESGTDLVVTPGFASRVDGMRNELLQEIHQVMGLFGGVVEAV